MIEWSFIEVTKGDTRSLGYSWYGSVFGVKGFELPLSCWLCLGKREANRAHYLGFGVKGYEFRNESL